MLYEHLLNSLLSLVRACLLLDVQLSKQRLVLCCGISDVMYEETKNSIAKESTGDDVIMDSDISGDALLKQTIKLFDCRCPLISDRGANALDDSVQIIIC